MAGKQKIMNKSEEEIVAALRLLFVKIAELSSMDIREMFLPGKYEEYRSALDTAYDALVTVEDALDSLGWKLENEHWRIDSAFSELKPMFLKQPRSRAEDAFDLFEQYVERRKQQQQPNL
jgi:hypothetical protein